MSFIIASVIRRHAEDASFYWARRSDAVTGREHDLRSLRRMEDLLRANLEGLRVAQQQSAALGLVVGAAAWQHVEPRLSRWKTSDEAFVAAVLALEAAEQGLVEWLQTLESVAQAQHDAGQRSDVAQGLAAAAAWLWPLQATQRAVRKWTESGVALWQLCAINSYQSESPPASLLTQAMASSHAVLAQAAARSASLWGLHEHTAALAALCRSEGVASASRCAAAAALCLLVGNQDVALGSQCLTLLDQAWSANPGHLELEPLVVWALMSPEAPSLIETALGERQHWRAAIDAVRYSADPRWLPLLLNCVRHQCQADEVRKFFASPSSNLARLAADSFAHIAGVRIANQLWQAAPEPGDGDEDALLNPAVSAAQKQDLDGGLLWPDPDALDTWWQGHGSQFAHGQRTLAGLALQPQSAVQTLADAQASQPQRLHAAYALQLMSPGARFDVGSPVPVQSARLQAMGLAVQGW